MAELEGFNVTYKMANGATYKTIEEVREHMNKHGWPEETKRIIARMMQRKPEKRE